MIFELFLLSFSKQNQPNKNIKQYKDFYLSKKSFLLDETIVRDNMKPASPLTLENTAFLSIKTTSQGGSIYMELSSHMYYDNNITNCRFDDCSSGWGGAFYIGSTFRINSYFTDCLFSRKKCTGFGGALYISNSMNTLKN